VASSLYTISAFGGLNLTTDPIEVGAAGATNMLDVDLADPGQIMTRAGYAKFTAATAAGTLSSLASVVYPATGSPRLLAWGGGTYYALDNTGTVLSSTAPASSTLAPAWSPGFWTFATYNGLAGRIVKLVSSTWTTLNISASVAVADDWSAIGSTPYSDRLILAGGSTAPDRVVFSDPGAGSWTTNNYVDLPNDTNAPTMAVAVYRDTSIVFKTDKYAVFGAESVDGTGNPVFNYRMVSTGIGPAARFGTATAPEGVYFIGRDGIYITAGDAPVRISEPIDAMFRGDAAATALGLDIAQPYLTQAQAAYYRGRLYVAVTTGASTTNNRLLVYDPKTRYWVVWSLPAASLCPHRVTAAGDEEMFFGYTSGSNDVGRHFRSYTTDAGVGIAWSHRTGRYEAGGGNEAVIPESSLVGSGTVTLAIASDLSDAGTFSAASASATLGTAPAVAEGWPSPIDTQGTYFQATLSGTGPAVVSEVRHHVSFVRKGASSAR
jgi:hypothetical protein